MENKFSFDIFNNQLLNQLPIPVAHTFKICSDEKMTPKKTFDGKKQFNNFHTTLLDLAIYENYFLYDGCKINLNNEHQETISFF